MGRPLRADAERNRARILESARVVFAERGLAVTLDDIARHAGVGVGTAYRRFPNKDALIEELFEERIAEIEALAREALALEDHGAAVFEFLERFVELQAADRGLKEAILSQPRGRDRLTRARARIAPLVAELIERGRRAGAVREGVAPSDVPMISLMVGAIADAAHELRPDLWRRYLQLCVDGLRAPGPLPVEPLTVEQVAEVATRLR